MWNVPKRETICNKGMFEQPFLTKIVADVDKIFTPIDKLSLLILFIDFIYTIEVRGYVRNFLINNSIVFCQLIRWLFSETLWEEIAFEIDQKVEKHLASVFKLFLDPTFTKCGLVQPPWEYIRQHHFDVYLRIDLVAEYEILKHQFCLCPSSVVYVILAEGES